MENSENLKKQASTLVNLYNSKNFEDVIKKGKLLIKKYPNQLLFYNATSLSLSAIGKNEEALKLLKNALNQENNNIHVLNNLGLISGILNKNELARSYYEKALSINENFIDALVNLANLNLKENRVNEAKSFLDKAASLSKSHQTDIIIYSALGQYHQYVGNFKEAIECFNTVNKINPINVIADKGISLVHKYTDENDPHLKLMEQKIEKIKDQENLQHLYFALGKAYEDLKKFDKSFKYISYGNKIADKKFNYNIGDQRKLFKDIKKLFENSKIDKKIEPKKKIIFIVGMPRSGTTLVEQILSCHNKIYGAGELAYLDIAIKENLMKNDEFIKEKIGDFDSKSFINVQEAYMRGINLFDYKEEFLVDKAPLNFKWIGIIKIIFPNSKIIHCKRDPMDVCFSNFKNNFSSKVIGFCYNLKKLGAYYNLYKDLMTFWNEKFDEDIFNLSYEELINNQEKVTKDLIEFCDLEWDENCLSPHKNNKTVATASLAQVRSPIYKTSIKSWENYKNELEEIKKIIHQKL